MIAQLLPGTPGASGAVWSVQSAAQESASRLKLFAILLLMLVIASFALAKFVLDAKIYADRRSGLVIACGTALCVVLAAILFAGDFVQSFPVRKTLLGSDVWSTAFRFMKAQRSGLDEWHFTVLLNFGILIGAGALLIVVIGSILCLGHSPADPAGCLEAQMARLRTYVTLGAAMLVSGVVFTDTWTHWPLFLFPDKQPMRASYSVTADSITLFTGIQFSLVLATLVGPVWVIQRVRSEAVAYKHAYKTLRRASRAAPGGNPAGTSVNWQALKLARTTLGLAADGGADVKFMVTVLSPFFAGTLGSLTSMISGAL